MYMSFYIFPCDDDRKTFTVLPSSVVKHLETCTLTFALLYWLHFQMYRFLFCIVHEYTLKGFKNAKKIEIHNIN